MSFNKINISTITSVSIMLALYIATLYAVNFIPQFNWFAVPTFILTIYAFKTKRIGWSLFIGFVGTIIIRMLMGWSFSFHWSLANGLQPAIIALIAKKYYTKNNLFIILLFAAILAMFVYPLASIVDYFIYQSKLIAVLQGLKYGLVSLISSVLAYPIIKNDKIIFN